MSEIYDHVDVAPYVEDAAPLVEEPSVSHLSVVDNAPEPTDRELLVGLHAKLDYVHAQNVSILNGLNATYSGVTQLLQLLAGVQQVAAMMPGRIGKAVRDMASNPPNGVSQ